MQKHPRMWGVGSSALAAHSIWGGVLPPAGVPRMRGVCPAPLPTPELSKPERLAVGGRVSRVGAPLETAIEVRRPAVDVGLQAKPTRGITVVEFRNPGPRPVCEWPPPPAPPSLQTHWAPRRAGTGFRSQRRASWDCKGCGHWGHSLAVPQRWNRMTTGSSDPTSGCVSERLENSVSKRCVHPHVPSRVTHGHQEVATTPVSVDGWTDEHSGSIHLAECHSAPKGRTF